MIASVAYFEFRRRLRLRSTLIFGLLLFVLGALIMSASAGAFDSVSVSTGEGKAFANSPQSLHLLLALLPALLVSIAAAFIGDSIYQDFEHHTYAFLLSTPLGKRRYLAGRLLGSFAALVVVFLAVPFGLWLATKMPWVKDARLGPNHLRYYLEPYLLTTVPTLALTSLVFFGIVCIARRIGPVHVAAVALLFAWLLSDKLTDGVHDRTLAAMVEPFGLAALGQGTEYWTVVERNTRLIPFTKLVLLNRALWLSLAAAFAAYGAYRFRPSIDEARAKRRRVEPPAPPTRTPVVPALNHSTAAYLRTLPTLTWAAARNVLSTWQIRVLLFLAFILLVLAARSAGEIFGTRTWPVTYGILQLIDGTVSLIAIAIGTLCAAELIFRNRQYRIQAIVDATPAPSWLLFTSNLGALVLVLVTLGVAAVVAGVGIQVAGGYFRLELPLYAKSIFGLMLPQWLMFSLLAFTVHSMAPNRHIGNLVVVAVFVGTLFFGQLGIYHNLLRYGGVPDYTYSDMNQFGPFVAPEVWFRFYWLAWASMLACFGLWLWRRGEDLSFRGRVKQARTRNLPIAAMTSAAIALGLAAFIYHATNIVNRYESPPAGQAEQARYERTYRHFLDEPQPRIRTIETDVALYPRELRATATGSYDLTNAETKPVTKILVSVDDKAKVDELALDRATTDEVDARLGIHVLTLAQPLAPGETAKLRFKLQLQRRAFHNDGEPTGIAGNGTFMEGTSLLPHIGYAEDGELDLDDVRARLGLPPHRHLPDPSDPRARMSNYVAGDSDWVTFGATVSTDEDQVALAPGELKRTWVENGRRYYRYEPGRPILGFVSFLSARYVVDRGRVGDIDIEIYRDPAHPYNTQRMIEAAGKALTTYGKRFSPYPYKVLRIAEFPRYASFAQSFPTLIPYSEGIGFIARVDKNDPDDIDYPFYITAHEVAHQWWAHRIVGGRAKGETLLSETLAEYSALTLLRDEVGAEHMGRFLRYEQRGYLRGRTFDHLGEKPLSLAENQQYIHYNKGSMATYLLAELAGREVVDGALRTMLDRYSDRGPPYPVSTDLTDLLRAAVPAPLREMVTDLFDRIVLYDLRARSASAKKLPDGRYEVTMAITVKKIAVDDKGAEHEVPASAEPAEDIDIGALGPKDAILHIERRTLPPGDSTITFIVDQKPLRAAIDPLYLRIDRKLDDNIVDVKLP